MILCSLYFIEINSSSSCLIKAKTYLNAILNDESIKIVIIGLTWYVDQLIDEEGNKILEYYSNIYKSNFLGVNQDEHKKIYKNEKQNITELDEKNIYVEGLKGSVQLTDFEIKMLTLN